MKALQCDFCGGGLIMDNSREFATCEFCGTKYMKETVQAKIQEIRGEVKVVGAVETFTGNTEKERLIGNAETYVKIKEYGKAAEAYYRIAQQFPDDYRGWWGVFTASIENYFLTGTFSLQEANALLTSYKLCPNRAPLDSYLQTVVARYGKSLRLAYNHNYSYFAFSFNAVQLPVLDNFTYWVIFKSANKLLPKVFTDFAANLTQLFKISLGNGSVLLIDLYKHLPYTNETLSLNTMSDTLQETAYLVSSLCNLKFLQVNDNLQPKPGIIGYSFILGGNIIKFRKILRIYARWAIVEDLQGEIVSVLLPYNITQESIYKHFRLCRHCGGRFKGMLKPICTRCGNPKDY